MLIASGMTAAITNPLEKEILASIKAADALMGHDENCFAWIRSNSQNGERMRRKRRRERSR